MKGVENMIKVLRDGTYNFTSLFNTRTGEYIRGVDVEDDPFMAEYPHLIDCGIMGSCVHGKSGLCLKAGIKCYQNGLKQAVPNMSLENYKKVIDQSKDRLFEIALGGRGDPDMHEDFEEILKYSRENGVVPNFTTSGLGMTPEKAEICKKYCGAVAVSAYSRLNMAPVFVERLYKDSETEESFNSEDEVSTVFDFGGLNTECIYDGNSTYLINGEETKVSDKELIHFDGTPNDSKYYRVFREVNSELENNTPNYTHNAICMLLNAGVKTNIHFVLSNTTIDEAILRVKYNGFPKGINAVIFLMHKPVGLGDISDVLSVNDPRVKEFFELIDKGGYPYKVGFDSCSIPGVLKWSKHIDSRSIDTCEGSRFSMYIDSDMVALPCSFDNQDKKFAVKLSDSVSIQDAWNSTEFNKFRDSLRYSCKGCTQREFCMGGCPLRNEIVLCDKECREFYGKE